MNKTQPILADAPQLARLLHGECSQVLATHPEASVDFVLTDPPYLVNARDTEGKVLRDEIDDRWLRPAFEQIYRVMKPNTLCLSFYGYLHGDRLLSVWKSLGLRPVGHLIFVKPYTSGTSFVKRKHEQAMLLAKGWPKVPQERLVDVLPWGRYEESKLLPTQKPVDMLQPLIRAFTKPGDLVLDPFCGSASTMLAAKLEGRRVIGIENDAEVYRLAKERLDA